MWQAECTGHWAAHDGIRGLVPQVHHRKYRGFLCAFGIISRVIAYLCSFLIMCFFDVFGFVDWYCMISEPLYRHHHAIYCRVDWTNPETVRCVLFQGTLKIHENLWKSMEHHWKSLKYEGLVTGGYHPRSGWKIDVLTFGSFSPKTWWQQVSSSFAHQPNGSCLTTARQHMERRVWVCS